uniref:Putative t-cell activation inhibitor mitochondrial n=1 Tax=Anopheles triannulatus TaxID=58253 RepID=A0A2M4AHB0_9DIPT
MYIFLKKCTSPPGAPVAGSLAVLHRMISSSEVATALRPFYFAVHPDLFGRYPQQRQVNEDSLKLLSAHLESLLKQRRILPSTPQTLPFYIRASNELQDRGTFNLIKVPLERTVDTKLVLRRILESCNLPTEFVDKMPSMQDSSRSKTRTAFDDFHQQQTAHQQSFYYKKRSEYNFGKEQQDDEDDSPFEKEFDIFQFKIKRTRENETLQKWLRKHLVTAAVRTKAVQELREEVEKLKEDVTKQLQLREIIYDCGWNVEHFRGCLKSLEKLAELHPGAMDGLKDRTLVFAAFTGVSLEGHVMLFTGDVQRNWLELIKTIDKHDSYLSKLPAYEYALSQVLRNIRIGRRKFMPKAQAMAYASHLRKITTALLDYLGRSKFPKSWPESLSQFELVVESEAGPLMVSPTGQLIVPATCPGSLVVDFFTNHLAEALEKQKSYDQQKYVERDLHARCLAQFRLLSLAKDDSVTPDRMIECLEKLLAKVGTAGGELELADLNLNITTYYSVLADGTVCIPWDWKQ